MRGKGKIAGIVITVVCLGLAFYQVNLQELLDALAGADYRLIVPAMLLWFIGYCVRTLRWRTLLAGSKVGSLLSLFGVLMVGFATNNLLPARLGELARAYLLRRKTGLRKTFVLASIFLERIFDGLALVAMLVVLSVLIDLPGWGREVEMVASALFVGVTFGVIVLVYRHELVARLVELVARPLPGRFSAFAVGAFGAFVSGLG